MMAPAFGYVLRRAAGGLEIVSRWAGDEPLKPTEKSGQNIWDQFTSLRKPPAAPAR